MTVFLVCFASLQTLYMYKPKTHIQQLLFLISFEPDLFCTSELVKVMLTSFSYLEVGV